MVQTGRDVREWSTVTDSIMIKCWDCGLELFHVKASERLSIKVAADLRLMEMACPHCGASNAYEMVDEQAEDFILRSVDAPLPDDDEEGGAF